MGGGHCFATWMPLLLQPTVWKAAAGPALFGRALLGAALVSVLGCESKSTSTDEVPLHVDAMAALEGDRQAGPVEGSLGQGRATAYKVSSREATQWKRYAALEADLAGALELAPQDLCEEFESRSCIRDVHLVPLGGNEPYVLGLYKPVPQPLATTSSAVDRVLLSACGARVRRDRQGTAKVFTALDLNGPAPSADSAAASDTIIGLYRRLLARDPEPEELALVASLLEAEPGSEPLSAEEFATLSCFAIGGSLEFLFF